jgi:hypothetical protein
LTVRSPATVTASSAESPNDTLPSVDNEPDILAAPPNTVFSLSDPDTKKTVSAPVCGKDSAFEIITLPVIAILEPPLLDPEILFVITAMDYAPNFMY